MLRSEVNRCIRVPHLSRSGWDDVFICGRLPGYNVVCLGAQRENLPAIVILHARLFILF
jgi:hypothetical protein